jgi:hypothetical protein
MLNKTIDDEPVCVCVCYKYQLRKILPFSNYNVRIIIQLLIKICGTPETLWEHTSVLWLTSCGTLLCMDCHHMLKHKTLETES